MLMRLQKRCILLGVPEIQPDGSEIRKEIGQVRAAFSHSSSEETEEGDVSRSSETVYAVIFARYAPMGGFRRSMMLVCGEDRYQMLNPVCLGTLWTVKCLRVQL